MRLGSCEQVDGVPRIETIGTKVRGEYGNLGTITRVLEHTRCSPRHITSPLDVVVELEPHPLGFQHTSAWASTLTPAQDGDMPAHPHTSTCTCGEPPARGNWQYRPASWRAERTC